MMAAKPTNQKFIGRAGGVVHVVTTKREDLKESKCPTVKKGHVEGVWPRKGMSAEAALELKGCVRCDTHAVAESFIKASMTPAQKRAAAKEARDATIQKMAKGKATKKSKAKAAGEPKRRGPKGGDVQERMKQIVEEHAAYARQFGWKGTAQKTGEAEWTAEVTRKGETLKFMYRDGRKVWARVVLKNGNEVRLRTSENWKRHAAGESGIDPDYQPKASGGGKKAAKAQVIDDSKARKLPFNIEDDDDTVIESLVGRRITWRNSQAKTLDTALVPSRSRNCRMTVHPKSGRRIISFYESQGFSEHQEQLGGERSVYLDKILRVK